MIAAKLSTSPEWHRLIVLLIDEMHVKESLVYNNNTGKMIGFVDLGSVNNYLLSFEESILAESEPPATVLADGINGSRTVHYTVPLCYHNWRDDF